MHQLNINLGNINDLQQRIDRLILVFNGFFILCIVSLVITILTIVFNRTVLKSSKYFSVNNYVSHYIVFQLYY